MNITLVKKTTILGEIFFHIKVDGLTERCFTDEQAARATFRDACQRAAEGYPKREVIEEYTPQMIEEGTNG